MKLLRRDVAVFGRSDLRYLESHIIGQLVELNWTDPDLPTGSTSFHFLKNGKFAGIDSKPLSLESDRLQASAPSDPARLPCWGSAIDR